ncbi:2-polyprenyl-3-methyl-5-hydroxy-6-metoxy-1,4-benzoquinol methylase [Sphingomonas laterariae]|uniref:2-polyprenyl-3-methyl-5-hydroxy-6-metoxy-1,4-benzoquinol methylase n=1 Tax=Edaphosphingomonas laterariae TaxID=861865 RepID=A0A239K6M9_9SPHN|nr:class I SAM-dependent methyltransferase [Sphingomonas laterariae]SNT13269.1 2-polyprenyl-3-methyl-5-hydroxy-6-metoxy-1,4-benzoquinol methylase [Sphingomonas laterariae]
MDRAIYDRMAEIDGAHWWFVARRRIIAELIETQAKPKPGARILEVGCGTGSNIPLLQRYGTVDAIEPDDQARALTTQRTGVAVKGGLLPDGVALDDGAYDLIVLLDVLEHIPGDRAALASLTAKLAPGGKILVTVPASPWMWSAHDVAHHHQRRYTMAAVKRVFADSGLKVRHATHFNTLLFPLIAAARLAGKISGREGGDDTMPPRPLNRLLGGLFAAERHWIGRHSLPFGVSIGLVAEPAN